MKILVVEDDLALSAGLCFALDTEGYLSVPAYTCAKARALLAKESFALVLLDVNLPDGDGFALCQWLREKWPNQVATKAKGQRAPVVIFLTANDLEADVLEGYALGAEDYVTKPFSMAVLLKRIEVALRRGGVQQSSVERWGDGHLVLDFARLTATRDGEVLAVTPNEYKLLRIFTENVGQILTRQQLLERLWDADGVFIDDHTLTVTVNRLRAKIEDEAHHYIKTVRGMGYIWTEAAR